MMWGRLAACCGLVGRPLTAILAVLVLSTSLPAQTIPYQRPVDTAPQEKTIGGGYQTPRFRSPCHEVPGCNCWMSRCWRQPWGFRPGWF